MKTIIKNSAVFLVVFLVGCSSWIEKSHHGNESVGHASSEQKHYKAAFYCGLQNSPDSGESCKEANKEYS